MRRRASAPLQRSTNSCFGVLTSEGAAALSIYSVAAINRDQNALL
jgi:hypothetical protein